MHPFQNSYRTHRNTEQLFRLPRKSAIPEPQEALLDIKLHHLAFAIVLDVPE